MDAMIALSCWVKGDDALAVRLGRGELGSVMLLAPVVTRRSIMACWLIEGRGSTSVVVAEVVEAAVRVEPVSCWLVVMDGDGCPILLSEVFIIWLNLLDCFAFRWWASRLYLVHSCDSRRL